MHTTPLTPFERSCISALRLLAKPATTQEIKSSLHDLGWQGLQLREVRRTLVRLHGWQVIQGHYRLGCHTLYSLPAQPEP